jgi:hypothetical protein
MSRMTSFGALGVLTLAMVFAPGGRVSAQSSEGGQQSEVSRPFRGLFGSGASTTSNKSLIFVGSLYGGWDSSVLADQPGSTVNAGDATSGSLAGVTAGLVYRYDGRRFDFGANVDTSARYYPQQQDLNSGAYYGGIGMNIELTRRTRLGLNQNIGYQPVYQLSLFPNLGDPVLGAPPVPSNLDYAASRSSGWIYDSGVSLDRQLSRRAQVSAFYRRGMSDFDVSSTTDSPAFDVNYQSGGFRFTRDLARGVALRVGYTYRTGDFQNAVDDADDSATDAHEIELGVNYGRQLSFSRRTTFSFSTGSTLFEVAGHRNFTVVGDAALRHQFGRNWMSSIAYNRGVGFFTNFSGPTLSDSVSARLDGLFGQRWMFSLDGGLSSGRVYGADEDALSRFTTYTTRATMQYAFTAYLASYAQYAYFYYDFPRSPDLPVGGEFDRNSVRVGLSLSVPLLR